MEVFNMIVNFKEVFAESMIQGYFSEHFIEGVRKMFNSTARNTQRTKMVKDFLLINPEVTYLGAGTNRVVFAAEDIVFKIALDEQGRVDNMSEYVLSQYEHGYKDSEEYDGDEIKMGSHLSKSYELYETGEILVSEYCRAITSEVFEDKWARKEIRKMLKDLANEYVFEDMGYSSRNFKNFGICAETGMIKVIDYAYMKPIDLVSLDCGYCNIGYLNYDKNYFYMVCNNDNCERKFRPFEVMSRPYDAEEDDGYYGDSVEDLDDVIGDLSYLYDDEEIKEMGILESLKSGVKMYRVYDVFMGGGED